MVTTTSDLQKSHLTVGTCVPVSFPNGSNVQDAVGHSWSQICLSVSQICVAGVCRFFFPNTTEKAISSSCWLKASNHRGLEIFCIFSYCRQIQRQDTMLPRSFNYSLSANAGFLGAWSILLLQSRSFPDEALWDFSFYRTEESSDDTKSHLGVLTCTKMFTAASFVIIVYWRVFLGRLVSPDTAIPNVATTSAWHCFWNDGNKSAIFCLLCLLKPKPGNNLTLYLWADFKRFIHKRETGAKDGTRKSEGTDRWTHTLFVLVFSLDLLTDRKSGE